MSRFKDSDGREWEIKLTLPAERKLYKDCAVYLSDIGANPTLGRLENEAVLLGDVLWSLIEEQARPSGVAKSQVIDGLSGELLEDAYEALVEATCDFLGRRGETIRKTRNERKRIEQELEEANIQGLMGLTGPQAYRMLQATSTAWAGSAPASSESTPETAPSAS
jgi:hypothetical protein